MLGVRQRSCQWDHPGGHDTTLTDTSHRGKPCRFSRVPAAHLAAGYCQNGSESQAATGTKMISGSQAARAGSM